jgi:hypothetical protein
MDLCAFYIVTFFYLFLPSFILQMSFLPSGGAGSSPSDIVVTTPKIWRVLINGSLWNQTKFEDEFHDPAKRRIPQSKGQRRMRTEPRTGDSVNFVIRGKIVMKGIVESDGFEHGVEHQIHPCNKGHVRTHSIPPEFAWVQIVEVGLSIPIRPTGQSTWAKMPTS